jgi:uncharacterized protein with FMN-binding domain
MKRYPAVIAATVAGRAGILSFHSRGTSQLSAALPVSARAANRATTTTTTPVPAGPGPTTTTTAAPAGPLPTTTAAPAPTAASALGATEQYGYGELAVRLTVSGSKITDAQVVGLQTAESYSQQIADQVIPYLRREVLSAQSAQIDAISGATYTSEAYAMSVQSALDQLHLK